MSWFDTPIEFAASFGGALAGTMATPSSFIYAPLRLASAATRLARPVLTRMLEQGVSTAATNAAIDTGLQVARITTGRQEEFSPLQTGISVLLGGAIGVGAGALAGRAAVRERNFFDQFDAETPKL